MEGELLLAIPVIIIFALVIIIIGITEKFGNLFIKIFINIRNLRLHVKAKYDDLIGLDRDINVDYSPAILSYLYNYKVEPKKDILATILNLYNKNILDIKKEQNKYIFVKKEWNDVDLSEDEKYIYNHLINKNINNFSSKEWEQAVQEEYMKYNFNEKKQGEFNSKAFTWYSAILSLIITHFARGTILYYTFGTRELGIIVADIGLAMLMWIFIFMFVWFFSFIIYCQMTSVMGFIQKFTEKGKTEIIKWIKFKDFIKNYTLIKDRKIEEIVLFEKYIPYAMVLNINKEYNNKDIKEFVQSYMKLIDKSTGQYLYTELPKFSDLF